MTESTMGQPACRLAGDSRSWHVLHTKSRQEKATAADLAALKVEYFLPLTREIRMQGARKVTLDTALFPGYLFLFGTLSDAYEVDRLGRLANIISVSDQPQLDRELRDLRQAMDLGVPLAPHPFLRSGVRVIVKNGPFAGLSGITETMAVRGRLVLQLSMLGRAVSVDIDTYLLEPC